MDSGNISPEERRRFESADLLGKLDQCGVEFKRRFYQREDPEDISKSIQSFRKAVELTPPDHPDLPGRLGNLGLSLMLRFERLGQRHDIDEAVRTLRRVVSLVPDTDPAFPLHAGSLGSALHDQFRTTEELEDLDEGLRWMKKAVELTPEGKRELPSWLANLGNALNTRFEYTGDLNENAEAISVQQKAVDLIPKESKNLPIALNCLGLSFRSRFEHTDALSDIDQAITTLETAVRLTPEDDVDLQNFLENLGISLACRFDRLGRRPDLSRAIETLEKAIELAPEDHAELPIILDTLSSCLCSQFEHTGELSDVDEAIARALKAVELTPTGHVELPKSWTTLGTAYRSRFISAARSEDLTECISSYRKAAQLTPKDHTLLPSRLQNLGRVLHTSWKATRDDSALHEAISVMEACVQLVSKNRPDHAAFLVAHGTVLFEMTGDLMHLSGAISAAQQDVHLCPTDHASLPDKLATLGHLFHDRYERTDDHSDINESVMAFRRALKLTDQAHPSRAIRLSELGASLRSIFTCEGNINDLSEAISLQREAVRLTHAAHANLPGQLASLGGSLTRRFETSHNLPDIAEAIEVQQRALKLTPPDHARLPVLFHNLGVSFIRRCGKSGNIAGIDEAIDAFQKAIQLTPATHVDLCKIHQSLGNALHRRFAETRDSGDGKKCIYHYQFASTFRFAPPQVRLEAGKDLIQSMKDYFPESYAIIDAFDTSINLIAIVTGMQHTTRRRYAYLQEMPGIPMDAAASAIHHERLDKAVEWLEQGRCLVWGQLTALRMPLQDLQRRDDALAQQLLKVSRALESSAFENRLTRFDMTIPEKLSVEQAALTQMGLANEWARLLEKARAIPGFEAFLQPAPFQSICQHLPASGFVVVVNINSERCDAIALSSGLGNTRHIALPRFTLSKAKQYRATLTRRLYAQGLRKRGDGDVPEATEEKEKERGESVEGSGERVGGRYRRNIIGDKDEIYRLLCGLWTEVVRPILIALNISKRDESSEHSLPRIWWCPTGPLSFLPLHAAGVYGGLECESALDYVVSSYTPTISSLTKRVEEDRPISKEVNGLFLTNHPNVRGFPRILETEREVRAIYDQAKEIGIKVVKVEGDSLSVDDCLKFMDEYSSIHLACHASQDASEPLRSRFRFHKGILDLETITKRNLKHADLAFLSACETSAGEERLSDEAVHLAAGMLAAGYRRVVATMWSIGDLHAPDVAIDFYKYLWDHMEEGGEPVFDGSLSAHALRHAVQKLRLNLDNTEKSLLAWIPYVHFGY